MIMPDTPRCIIKWRALGSEQRIGPVRSEFRRACLFFGAIPSARPQIKKNERRAGKKQKEWQKYKRRHAKNCLRIYVLHIEKN
jgi:hypothetical protein